MGRPARSSGVLVRNLGWLVASAGLLAGVGCNTHRSLSRNTLLTTGTVMDIQYRSVLSNLALLSRLPAALPNHVHLADGVVQINDRVGYGQAGGFTTVGGAAFGIEQFGPSGQRQVTEQWGTDATTDPERLYDLQSLYRAALGTAPLPPPNAIVYLRKRSRSGDGEHGSKSPGSAAGNAADPTSTGGGGSTPSGGGSSGGDGGRRVPLDVLLSDVPAPGWYHIGRERDVPDDACYVGRSGDRYAWVTAAGMPQLARFTMTVLMVIKLKPGERGGGKSGLAVTGGQ
jgi:uncharacterized membrane protein YgcG